MASSRSLAAWYFRIAQSLEAGIPLLDTLAAPGGPAPRQREAMVGRLRGGAMLHEELYGSKWLPQVDIHLLAAGAQIGRLPSACRRLAAHHDTAARLSSRALLATLYPLAVLHLGAFLFPLRQLVCGESGGYLRQVASTIGPLWLALAVVFILLRRYPGLGRAIGSAMPWVRGYQRARALGVLASVLEGYAAAGVSPVFAWAAAGRATGVAPLAALGERMAAEAEAGRPPGQALAAEPLLPVEFAQSYRAGEMTGRLDESLGWLGRSYTEQAERNLTLVSIWYPQAVLLGVGVWVAVEVLSIYSGYIDSLMRMMD
jgi:type II secretory pathway component PulF